MATETRMHSSRMRTVCCSSRLLGVGGPVCLPRRVYLQEVSASQGVSAWAVSACQEGVYLPGGGCTPPLCEQTDICENITFLQLLLRMVKIGIMAAGGGVHTVMAIKNEND